MQRVARKEYEPVADKDKTIPDYVTDVVNEITEALPYVKNTDTFKNFQFSAFVNVLDTVAKYGREMAAAVALESQEVAGKILIMLSALLNAAHDLVEVVGWWKNDMGNNDLTNKLQMGRNRFIDTVKVLNTGMEIIEKQAT